MQYICGQWLNSHSGSRDLGKIGRWLDRVLNFSLNFFTPLIEGPTHGEPMTLGVDREIFGNMIIYQSQHFQGYGWVVKTETDRGGDYDEQLISYYVPEDFDTSVDLLPQVSTPAQSIGSVLKSSNDDMGSLNDLMESLGTSLTNQFVLPTTRICHLLFHSDLYNSIRTSNGAQVHTGIEYSMQTYVSVH
jgi:hypothetical protein